MSDVSPKINYFSLGQMHTPRQIWIEVTWLRLPAGSECIMATWKTIYYKPRLKQKIITQSSVGCGMYPNVFLKVKTFDFISTLKSTSQEWGYTRAKRGYSQLRNLCSPKIKPWFPPFTEPRHIFEVWKSHSTSPNKKSHKKWLYMPIIYFLPSNRTPVLSVYQSLA